ncbi:MAG: DUF1631 domain-containing protein [Pseudomonadota bacterium]
MNAPRPHPYQQTAQLFLRGISSRTQSFFESVDNALFDMAEKAESNALQTHYFDGMRQVRKTRTAVEQSFQRHLRQGLIGFQKGQSPRKENKAASEPSADQLSLVDDAELEQNLALSEMVAKGENRLSRPLYALNQRLGAALRITPPDDELNPLGPAAICRSLREAAPAFEVELPVLLVIYKLFDKHVLEPLEPLYQEINDALATSGVLPQLTPRQAGRSSGAGGGNAPVAAAAPPSDPGEIAEGAPDMTAAPLAGAPADESEAIQAILSLLTARRAGQPRPATAAPVAQTGQLLNALSLLQAAPAPASAATEDLDISTLLSAQLQQLDGPTQASETDQNTIDLVGMLFQFILEDRNLPDAMQALLSRLQIPYIKAALLDRQLFASREHPARRLLDELAEVAMGFSADSDRGNRLRDQITRIVDRISEDFDDDLGMFDDLRDELGQFASRQARRAEVAEKRTTEATLGQQRLAAARRGAARAVRERTEELELPSILKEILAKPWANVLVLTQLRHGDESAEYADALKFIDDLIWTAQPKTRAADVKRLQKDLPDLSRQLRSGLEMVAYHEDDIRRVFKSLKTLYHSMVDAQYREQLELSEAAPPPTMSLPAAVAPVQLPISGAADVEEEILDEASQTPEPVPLEALEEALREQVESLEVGTWFQFAAEEGPHLRAKLSWKSPITGNYLFVDNKGIKVADKPVAELANDLAAGNAVALETVPLFDRALTAIADRLQSETDTADEPD